MRTHFKSLRGGADWVCTLLNSFAPRPRQEHWIRMHGNNTQCDIASMPDVTFSGRHSSAWDGYPGGLETCAIYISAAGSLKMSNQIILLSRIPPNIAAKVAGGSFVKLEIGIFCPLCPRYARDRAGSATMVNSGTQDGN